MRENRALRHPVWKKRSCGRTAPSPWPPPSCRSEMLEQSLIYPKQSVELNMSSENIMSVDAPIYHFPAQNRRQR